MKKRRQFIVDLISLYSAIMISGLSGGILSVLIPIKMSNNVDNDILISVSFSTQIIAGILFAKYLPRLAKKIGVFNVVYLTSAIAGITIIFMYEYINYFIWLILVFTFGASLFAFATTRQTMLIEIASPKSRALIVSGGSMTLALSLSAGSYIVKFIGFFDLSAYLASAFLQLLSIVPMMFVKNVKSHIEKVKKAGLRRYIRYSPKIMFAALCFNYVSSALYSFIIIYGLKIGLDNAQAASLLTVLLIGTIFSIPIGYITDRINRRIIILISNVLSLGLAIYLYNTASKNPENIHIILLFMFSSLIGIRLPALILINEKYKPRNRLSVNAAFGKMCAIGNVMGALGTGIIIQFNGANGLWISIISMLSFYLIFTISNYMYKFFTGTLNIGGFFVEHKLEDK